MNDLALWTFDQPLRSYSLLFLPDCRWKGISSWKIWFGGRILSFSVVQPVGRTALSLYSLILDIVSWCIWSSSSRPDTVFLTLALIREKGIITLRIYQHWIFHYNDWNLFWDVKFLRTWEKMTLFKQ